MVSVEGKKREEKSREARIVRVSVLGIVTNVALAAFKAAVGILSHSIAITLDAVNNLSDAASSVITILGTKLASKSPDRRHPYGHGRYEYLTAMAVSGIVLWAGLTSLWEAIKSIIEPSTPSYAPGGLIIIAVAVVVKFVLGRFFVKRGKDLNSGSLVASGEDASFDAIISLSTLVAAGIFLVFGLALEGWLGAAISVVIIKSGIEMLREALDKVLGERVDGDLAREIKQDVCAVDGVRGAYDLLLNDYGPQRLWGSIHVEVDEDLRARDVDRLTREVQEVVYAHHGVILHTVGIYSANTHEGSKAQSIRRVLTELADQSPYVLQVHGLYVDTEQQDVVFDLVVSFDAPDRNEVGDQVVEELKRRFPTYSFSVVLDTDVSD